MYFVDSIFSLIWWFRYILMGSFVIGLIGWSLGHFRETSLKTGFVGFNRDGFPIYCEIISIGKHSIPVYYACDWRGTPRYNIDENWNIVQNSFLLF